MLQRKPVNRLGYNGITEIKDHPWLKYYPWRDLYEKNLEAPFVPKNNDNFDKKYCEGPDKIGNDTLERYQNYYKNESLNEIFINYSFDNLLTIPSKIELVKKNSNKSNHNTYLNNINNPQKKRINSSISNVNLNKNSLNNLLKTKMKITESLYLNNNVSGNINISNINNNIKNTPNKTRTNSINMNTHTPNHVRHISVNSNFYNNPINNNYQNLNNNFLDKTPNKNRSLNNLNILKSRTKNLSINNSTNISNINIINNSNVNIHNNININNSTTILNFKQSSATPYKNNDKVVEKLPFIEQKLMNSKQYSTNLSAPKKILNSPLISKGIGYIIQNIPKSGSKYTTLSANSTGNSTNSMNFLHKRSGSTNTFNNY